MITPRTTRLVRVADLRVFRSALGMLACEGDPFAVRDRLVVVPTRAAAAHLVRAIERRVSGATALPLFTIAGELVWRFAARLDAATPRLNDAEREALLGVACRAAREEGLEPPFGLRPGLVAEVLRFYDALRRNLKDVDTFERLALGALEPGMSTDRGAARLVLQTRFLASAFRHFERLRLDAGGEDEHTLRAAVLARHASRPIRHVVLGVADRARDAHGLTPADWDLLSRVPDLERLDVVVTDQALAGALHERLHQLLPGIEETRFDDSSGPTAVTAPMLLVPPDGSVTHVARDREEEVAGFCRWVKGAVRRGELHDLEAAALVVRQPLPYVYLSRELLRSAGVPCQMFDALPLGGEPYAAAVDLIFSFVSSNFARVPAIALLRSPHLRFETAGDARAVAALDRALSEAGYLGDHDALVLLVARWRADDAGGLAVRAREASEALLTAVESLTTLRAPGPVAMHLDILMAFLRQHERLPGPDDPLRKRQLRARSAILGVLETLRDAYARFDASPVPFDVVAAMVRRWIEAQTFVPRVGDRGVHVVDASSAPFGDFEYVQLAGVVEGEWPDRPRRNIFYSPSILRELGWTGERERLDGARMAFGDLLRLAGSRVRVSTFAFEDDAIVAASALVDDVARAAMDTFEQPPDDTAIFDDEALAMGPPRARDASWCGRTQGAPVGALSLSALERYQDCPFKFFAADVLRIEELPEDESTLSPRVRGRFIHEVFQRFFQAWDAAGRGVIGSDRLDTARALFEQTAEPLLQRLPDAEAALERARLFGSAISVGIVDVVLALEATRPVPVTERWLEHRFEGVFTLGGDREVTLKGVADRVDLLRGNQLRVIDYKSGLAPDPRRALQVPIYALCVAETLAARDGTPWSVDEAAYIALAGRRSFVPVIRSGDHATREALADARERLYAVVDGVVAGEFPPRPHESQLCRHCAYPSVCRKDYVHDE